MGRCWPRYRVPRSFLRTDIKFSVYAIGGWADSYTNAIPRLLAGLSVPAKGLVGPWGHQYPHQGHPGPAVGFLQDGLRWWDHWLKGIDTGVMKEPRYRVWMEGYTPPRAYVDTRPGRWVAEEAWPSQRIRQAIYHLNETGLETRPAAGGELVISSPQTTGATYLNWINGGASGSPDEPVDQRQDDANSLTFDSRPLDQASEILGSPEVSIDIRSKRRTALSARGCARSCPMERRCA